MYMYVYYILHTYNIAYIINMYKLQDLVGSTSSIPLTFKGHSVSPTFHFDLDRISFGVVIGATYSKGIRRQGNRLSRK